MTKIKPITWRVMRSSMFANQPHFRSLFSLQSCLKRSKRRRGKADCRPLLAAPVDDRLFFAGEARIGPYRLTSRVFRFQPIP